MASHLMRLSALARAGAQLALAAKPATQSQAVAASATVAWRSFTPKLAFSSASVTDADVEHAVGIEKEELVARQSNGNEDPWREAWLDAPYGTETSPVEVTSAFSERIVGVTDPDDDSLVWWGVIEEGQAPKQIIEDGEFFVLKRIPNEGGQHH
ncbi:hypothetical protein H632_c1336p0 [Helicosporidium sp. ATCC 50920]|nr:hypothetical protein H632_c1336p0 [Helicosporidium sp. ATCC 50920]|eukprot:KDD74406.1 hypothetical protein H632_c1336p0 [Helicosporidium sp. ATCC 50920]